MVRRSRHGFNTAAIGFFLQWLLILPVAQAVPRGMPAPDDPLYQMRDPFRRPAPRVIRQVPRTEIEMIPLDQFRLVGVSTGPKQSRALVETMSGRSWFIGLNDLIGTNGGVVRQILPDKVLVAQKVFDELGQEQQVMAEIRFSGNTGGGGQR